MKFQEAEQLISNLPSNQAILLIGPPGTGKSTLATYVAAADTRRVAREKGIDPEQVDTFSKVCDLACYLPEDLLGVPFKDREQIGGIEHNVTRHAPPAWIGELSVPQRNGLLLLDDIGAASKSVQVAAFRLVQERAAGDSKLSDNVRIMCTTNRREDKSGASTLPAALLNRMVILQIEPDLEEWSKWFADKDYPTEISSFLQFRPSHLSKLPKDADKRGAFATPRSWEKLAQCFTAAKRLGMIFDVAEGLVGEGVATEFCAFVKTIGKLPDPRAVLEDPKGTLPHVPSEPDKLIAIVTGLAEHAAKSKENGIETKFLKALTHVCSKSFEYVGTAVTVYVNRGGELHDIVSCIRSNSDDKELIKLLRHLDKALA